MDRTTEINETVVEQAVDGEPHDPGWTTGQAGSGSFPELVRAHFDWERAGCSDGADERRYRQRLQAFEAREGELLHVYWATRRPSAVALTVKPKTGLAGVISDHDAVIRLHRVTDWLGTGAADRGAFAHCDTLAIKVSQVLRGTPERIAMQWLYAVQSHLLGFIERTHGRADAKQLAAVVESQKRELIQIEKYYTRAAEKAARIVYFWGMMVTRLRKLHSRGDPGSASFKRTLRMLREHTATRDNASATWFRHVLQSHQTALEEINRTSLIGLVREQVDSEGNVVSTEQVSPAETFWDWVYGVYLHDAEDKLARVESWRPISLHKFNFLQMATDLSRLYYSFSGIVREVLAVPTLVPHAFSEGS